MHIFPIIDYSPYITQISSVLFAFLLQINMQTMFSSPFSLGFSWLKQFGYLGGGVVFYFLLCLYFFQLSLNSFTMTKNKYY